MPATVAPVPPREADGESGTARDVEKFGVRTDAEPREHREQHVDGVVLVEARPVGGGVAPGLAGGPPVVTGLRSRGRVGRRHRPILTMRALRVLTTG